jgi:hypothetical protein
MYKSSETCCTNIYAGLPTVSCTEDELEQGEACYVDWALSDAVLPILRRLTPELGEVRM